MTETNVEGRLRRAMGPRPDEAPADPAVLSVIRERAGQPGQTRANRFGASRPGAGPMGYRVVLGAAAAALMALVLAWTVAGAGRDQRPAPPADPPAARVAVDLPAAPSWWWLVGASVVAATFVGWIHRHHRDRLITVAATAVSGGLLVVAAVTWPDLRLGAELAHQAPEVPGYDLVEARLRYRPESAAPYQRATLVYQPRSGQLAAPPVGDVSIREPLDPSLRALGFDQYLANFGQRCINRAGPAGLGHYCLVEATDGRLVVAASLWPPPTRVPPAAGLALVWLGLVCLVLARLERVTVDAPDRPALPDQLRYATALILLSFGLYLTGRVAIDLLRVGSFGFARSCRLGDSRWLACSDRILAAIHDRGVAGPAARIYLPLIGLSDLGALALAAGGWRLGVASRPGPRRHLLLKVLAAVVAIVIVVPLVLFRQRIGVLNDFNE